MKRIIALILFCAPVLAFSSWDGCKADVNESLSTEREQFVLKEKSSFLSQIGLDRCDGNIYGNMVVAIHEGVHFIDLGIGETSNLLNKEVGGIESLFLTDMSRLNIPDVSLPSPYSVLELDHSYWKIMFNDFSSMSFSFDYKEYIEEEGMASSSNAFYGLGTEFNAYAHGSLTAWNLRSKTKELESNLPGSIVTQRSGLLFFMGITSQYLKLIKSYYPHKWSELVLAELTSQFYGKLFKQAYDALVVTKDCSSSLHYEKSYLDFVLKTVDDNLLKDLSIPFSSQEMIKKISCFDPTS